MSSPNLFKVTVRQQKKTAASPAPTDKAPPAESAGQVQTRQRADSEIVMKPELANQWSVLKRVGLLADLPASARSFDLGDKHPDRQMKSVLEFRFVAPRDAVRRWLVDSHCTLRTVEKRAAMGFVETSHALDEPSALQWPSRPEVFTRTYAAAGQCVIKVESTENDDVHVKISHAKPSILIAPEESQQPRPKGRLAPEYYQEGLTTVQPPAPKLDSGLNHLRSGVSGEEEEVPWRVFFDPTPVYQQASVGTDYLQDEEALVLRRGNLSDKSLLVRLPLTR